MPEGTNVVTLNYPTSEELANIDIYGWDRANPNAQFKIPIGEGGILSGEGSSAGGGTGGTTTTISREVLTFNFSADGAVKFYADIAMTITFQSTSGAGSATYSKSTAAAPGTFTSTSSPVTLEAGAWFMVAASGVTGEASDPFAVAWKRTA